MALLSLQVRASPPQGVSAPSLAGLGRSGQAALGAPTPSALSPVDTGLGRNMPRGWPVSSTLARSLPLSPMGWGLHAGTVVSSADRGRQSPMLGLAMETAGSRLPSEGDRRSLHTEAQEVDREQEPASLSS